MTNDRSGEDVFEVPDSEDERHASEMLQQRPTGKRKAEVLVISDDEGETEIAAEPPSPPPEGRRKRAKDDARERTERERERDKETEIGEVSWAIVDSIEGPAGSDSAGTAAVGTENREAPLTRRVEQKKQQEAYNPLMGDRKKLEAERLARKRQKEEEKKEEELKRKLQVAPTQFYGASAGGGRHRAAVYNNKRWAGGGATGSTATSVASSESTSPEPTTTATTVPDVVSLVDETESTAPANAVAESAAADVKSQLEYPRGVVKKTRADGPPGSRSGSVTIEQVLGKKTLVLSLLSAFQWDYEWIMSKLPLGNKEHRMVFVMQGKDPVDRMMKEQVFGGLPRIELVFPNMDGQVNCMHSKLMLLFHKRGDTEWLRIVVPTANLTDYDWGETGSSGGVTIMENMVFMIDLPKKDTPDPEQTFFLVELLRFAAKQGIPDHVLNALVHYDFAETESMAFVHSIGGSHGTDEWMRTGFCGLGTAIKKLGYYSGKGLEVDYVTSSLGAAKGAFVGNIYRAAQGHTGERRLKKPALKTTKSKRKPVDEADETTEDESECEEENDWERIKSRFRVYFPSRGTVRLSHGGPENGGTVCFQRKWWEDENFPKGLVQDCKSVRSGLLMHNKLLFARPSNPLHTPHGKIAAWAYVGSANFSESAWGRLVMDRATKKPKINCKNWECGVVLPVPAKSAGQTLSGIPPPVEQAGMDVFEGTVPVPMEVPGESLGEGPKEPWFFMEAIR